MSAFAPFDRRRFGHSASRSGTKDWRNIPAFTDITGEACAFLEAACNVRYFEQEQICKDGDPRSRTYVLVLVEPALSAKIYRTIALGEGTDFIGTGVAFSPTRSAALRYWNMARQRYCRRLARSPKHPERLCRPRRQADRPQPRGKPKFLVFESGAG